MKGIHTYIHVDGRLIHYKSSDISITRSLELVSIYCIYLFHTFQSMTGSVYICFLTYHPSTHLPTYLRPLPPTPPAAAALTRGSRMNLPADVLTGRISCRPIKSLRWKSIDNSVFLMSRFLRLPSKTSLYLL